MLSVLFTKDCCFTVYDIIFSFSLMWRREGAGVREDAQHSTEAGDVWRRRAGVFFFWSASCSQTLDSDSRIYPWCRDQRHRAHLQLCSDKQVIIIWRRSSFDILRSGIWFAWNSYCLFKEMLLMFWISPGIKTVRTASGNTGTMSVNWILLVPLPQCLLELRVTLCSGIKTLAGSQKNVM